MDRIGIAIAILSFLILLMVPFGMLILYYHLFLVGGIFILKLIEMLEKRMRKK